MSSCGFSELHSTCTYNFYSENFEVSKHNIDPNFEDPYEMRGKKMNDIDPNCWSETRTETILNMINIRKKSYILVSTKKQVRGQPVWDPTAIKFKCCACQEGKGEEMHLVNDIGKVH